MPHHSICIDCGRTVEAVRRSRCVSCFAREAKRTNNWTGRMTEARAAHQAFITSSAWRKVASLVKARDGQTCVDCDATTGLTVHHLVGVRLAPDLALDPSNCITVCRSCHGRRESKGGRVNARRGAYARRGTRTFTDTQNAQGSL